MSSRRVEYEACACGEPATPVDGPVRCVDCFHADYLAGRLHPETAAAYEAELEPHERRATS